VQVNLLTIKGNCIGHICRAIVVCAVKKPFCKHYISPRTFQKLAQVQVFVGSEFPAHVGQKKFAKRRRSGRLYNFARLRTFARKKGVIFTADKAGRRPKKRY
jgi:hypothetical protein